MAKKNNASPLIFIDTNIFLDFYRIRKSDISLKYLHQIEGIKHQLILTGQVEMEFKKNRQKVIMEALGEINKVSSNGTVNVPTILSDVKAVEMIKKAQKGIAARQKKIKQRVDKILTNPQASDKVFQTFHRIFKTKSPFNLGKRNPERIKIRELAQKRFMLGYPPRKKEDNSIGDAINWEWIVACANDAGRDVIIVTRDSDYGVSNDDKLFLNDWLQIEFRERVRPIKKIILTDKLSVAFKQLNLPVTKAMKDEEDKVINERIEGLLLKFIKRGFINRLDKNSLTPSGNWEESNTDTTFTAA